MSQAEPGAAVVSVRPVRSPRRALDGLLLLDKPRGMTSNQALQVAKRLLAARKAGHTGSLDPIATGLLPLLFGEATKLSQFLLDADKRYWTVVQLGVTTTTQDSEGEVTQTRPVTSSWDEVVRVVAQFQGEIEQIPPMYSALKREGRPLYELARAGVEVEREPRRLVIRSIQAIELANDRLTLDIECSKGTYVRTLAHDIGEKLGCGAHVVELRRLAVGGLHIDQATDLDTLETLGTPAARAARLQPADCALIAMPAVRLTAAATDYLRRGMPVVARPMPPIGWVRLYDANNRFLGVGQALDDGRVTPRRLIASG